MSFPWYGQAEHVAGSNYGSLAVVWPLLQRMNVAGIINQHVPKDPQAEFDYGDVLELLIAARLHKPTALMNVSTWASESSAEALWGIPPDKLNDDRLGRALDHFFEQRHSIAASVALHVSETFGVSLERLHYDPTHILFHGAYESSQPRNDSPLPPQTSSANYDPAHITFGHASHDKKIVHAGISVAVDKFGPVPIFGHTTSGNNNGHTAIDEQFQLVHNYLQPNRLLMISDRGTFSVGHLARLQREGFHALCSANWKDFRSLYDENRQHLQWRKASYLSIEQQRRRKANSSLPKEHYELAVLKHELTDSASKEVVPCRVIFVYSTADEKVTQKNRDKQIEQLRNGLDRITQTVARGHARSDEDSIRRRIIKLFGNKAAARYFQWQMLPLSEAEQAALPPPQRGCRRPTHRFVYSFDENAVAADRIYDGLSVLVTTAPRSSSADLLFTQFKEQIYAEQSHHQFKTPLAIHPLFLKSPKRVESLVHLMMIALTAYHLLQRVYRQSVPEEASDKEKRTTTETILRAFANYTLILRRSRLGKVINPTQLSAEQRKILNKLGFPTPAQILREKLPQHPL